MTINTNNTRTEKDLLGTMVINNEAFYGIQTQRAINNFQLSQNTLTNYPEIIQALAWVKLACAKANYQQSLLEHYKFEAIENACRHILTNEYNNQFPIDMIQGGAGTSTNMNVNEVIANIALSSLNKSKGDYGVIHPNSDVNMSQSTNDVYPSAIRLSILLKQQPLIIAVNHLILTLQQKALEFKDVIKLARTQLQDAVPMTLGQEFNGFASTLKEDILLIESMGDLLKEINLGGTAVGTGINTKKGFGSLAVSALSETTKIKFTLANDLIEASSDMGAFVIYSAALKRLALKLSKIANDLRLLSMGPKAGLSEISLPARQPGSSIMPGKVNPVIPEAVSQCAYQVAGNDVAISMAAEAGQLQLNAMEPLIAYNLHNSMTLITNACVMFDQYCVSGIEANIPRCKDLLDNSLGVVTALNPYLGYEIVSDLAKTALLTGSSVIDLIKQQNLLSDDLLQDILSAENMTQPS